MNLKAVVLSSLLGGLALFFWGAAAHTLIPTPIHIITDTSAIDDLAAKVAPTNGAYMDPRGLMVINGFLPGKTDKSKDMSPMLIAELTSNLIQAAMLTFLFLHLKPTSLVQYGVLGGFIGVMIFVASDTSYNTWYSFPIKAILIDLIDSSIGGLLAGMVIGWQIRKAA